MGGHAARCTGAHMQDDHITRSTQHTARTTYAQTGGMTRSTGPGAQVAKCASGLPMGPGWFPEAQRCVVRSGALRPQRTRQLQLAACLLAWAYKHCTLVFAQQRSRVPDTVV